MTSDIVSKWENILESVDKHKIPVYFIKKLIVKLKGKKQRTINVVKLMNNGLSPEQLEEVVNNKLGELQHLIVSVEFVLNVEAIAEIVQPETDYLLANL